MATSSIWLIGVFLATFFQGAACEYCYTGYTDISYCSYGCCGSYDSDGYEYQYCCGNITGAVVGGVVGGLLLISIFVTICICYQKKRATAGMIVHPNGGYNGGGPTVVMASSNQQNSPSYGYGPTAHYPLGPPQGGGQGPSFQQNGPPPYAGGGAYPGASEEKSPFHPQY